MKKEKKNHIDFPEKYSSLVSSLHENYQSDLSTGPYSSHLVTPKRKEGNGKNILPQLNINSNRSHYQGSFAKEYESSTSRNEREETGFSFWKNQDAKSVFRSSSTSKLLSNLSIFYLKYSLLSIISYFS